MSTHPGMRTRLMARLHGEVSADTVDAYRRAGAEVYDLIGQLDQARVEWEVKGLTAWTAPKATQAALLAAWNAFALQVLGDEMVAADYATGPTTVGFLPPVTAQQALAFYGPVPTWLGAVRQAQASPSFTLDVAVPAPLPPFVAVEPCPPAHLAAMRAATQRLRTQAEATLAGFALGDSDEQRRASDAINELVAGSSADADYAERLWADHLPPGVHADVERHLTSALRGYFELGQLVAMPALILQPRPTPAALGALNPPRYGGPDFDPWCLTDAGSRTHWQQDRQARRSIQALWANDPDPQATLQTRAEIDAAFARGDISYATDRYGQRLGHYYCCPWSAIYVTKRPVMIGGVRLHPLQQFTFDVSAEEVDSGGAFTRQVTIANFHPTDEVDYCNPDS